MVFLQRLRRSSSDDYFDALEKVEQQIHSCVFAAMQAKLAKLQHHKMKYDMEPAFDFDEDLQAVLTRESELLK